MPRLHPGDFVKISESFVGDVNEVKRLGHTYLLLEDKDILGKVGVISGVLGRRVEVKILMFHSEAWGKSRMKEARVQITHDQVQRIDTCEYEKGEWAEWMKAKNSKTRKFDKSVIKTQECLTNRNCLAGSEKVATGFEHGHLEDAIDKVDKWKKKSLANGKELIEMLESVQRMAVQKNPSEVNTLSSLVDKVEKEIQEVIEKTILTKNISNVLASLKATTESFWKEKEDLWQVGRNAANAAGGNVRVVKPRLE